MPVTQLALESLAPEHRHRYLDHRRQDGVSHEKISRNRWICPYSAPAVAAGVRPGHNAPGRCPGAANPVGSVVSYFRTLVLASQAARLAYSLRAPARGFGPRHLVVARDQRVHTHGHDGGLGYRRAGATGGGLRLSMDVERHLVRPVSKSCPLAFFRVPRVGLSDTHGYLVGGDYCAGAIERRDGA